MSLATTVLSGSEKMRTSLYPTSYAQAGLSSMRLNGVSRHMYLNVKFLLRVVEQVNSVILYCLFVQKTLRSSSQLIFERLGKHTDHVLVHITTMGQELSCGDLLFVCTSPIQHLQWVVAILNKRTTSSHQRQTCLIVFRQDLSETQVILPFQLHSHASCIAY